jgi:hypothetical protein
MWSSNGSVTFTRCAGPLMFVPVVGEVIDAEAAPDFMLAGV